jgi:hypothetical protein
MERDNFMSAQQAVDYGLADKIVENRVWPKNILQHTLVRTAHLLGWQFRYLLSRGS